MPAGKTVLAAAREYGIVPTPQAGAYAMTSLPRLLAFAQPDPATLRLRFDPASEVERVVALDRLAPTFANGISSFAGGRPVPFDRVEGGYAIHLREAGLDWEYSLVVVGNVGRPFHLELIRQPSSWLLECFSYLKPGGFTILGRRSVHIDMEGPALSLPPLRFADRPIHVGAWARERDVGDLPAEVAPFPELCLATRLTRWLWDGDVWAGVTPFSYDDFLAKGFNEKLALVRSGGFSVSCQGFRDLFLHAASALPAVTVRAIEAFDALLTGNLIPYSHAIAEIKVAALNAWVLFDPWLGLIVVDDAGQPLSAADLAAGTAKAPRMVRLIPLQTVCYRHANGDVNRLSNVLTACDLHAWVANPVGHTPAYTSYLTVRIVREHGIHPS